MIYVIPPAVFYTEVEISKGRQETGHEYVVLEPAGLSLQEM